MVEEIFQLKVISINKVDFSTFVVDFYIMENVYICGCNTSSSLKLFWSAE